MSTLQNPHVYQKWSRFIIKVNRDSILMNKFLFDPTIALREEGIIDGAFSALVKKSIDQDKVVDVVIMKYSEVLFLDKINISNQSNNSLWNQLVIELSNNDQLKNDFLRNPKPILVSKGLITEQGSYVFLPSDSDTREFELLLCDLTDVLYIPSKNKVDTYFENLPRPDSQIMASGCAIPGGCSTI